MRLRLLTLASVAATTLILGVAAAAGTPPGSSYQWQQPGCAPVTTPCAQPTLSFPTVPSGLTYVASAGYQWAQPGTAPPLTTYGSPG